MKRLARIGLLLFLVLALGSAGATRAHAVSLIRDAEIENTIRTFATPLLRAAGVNPDSVRIFLINDRSINAFVAGGMNLFIHTGLLKESDGPEAVIGVLAHEIGHIAGGHLARTPEAVQGAGIEVLLSYLLGVAVAVAGAPDAGTAIMAGGAAVGQSAIIRYTQAQEESADQAALSYLQTTGQSARGLLDLLQTLRSQELLVTARQSPYLRTHPLTQDRISHVRNYLATSAYADAPPRPEYVEMYRRMLAKLDGFLEPPGHTLAKYPDGETSLEARYARAIAHFHVPELARALKEIDGLIAEHPHDPYFYELKGQMLFENGRVREAIEPYEKAVTLLPGEPLLRLGLAQAQIETNDPGFNEAALGHLKKAVLRDRTNAFVWHYLGIAYGRNEQYGDSALALAEEAFLQRRKEDLDFHIGRAERYLAEGSPGWLRLQDLKRAAERLKAK